MTSLEMRVMAQVLQILVNHQPIGIASNSGGMLLRALPRFKSPAHALVEGNASIRGACLHGAALDKGLEIEVHKLSDAVDGTVSRRE
jgi:hypothetical protein